MIFDRLLHVLDRQRWLDRVGVPIQQGVRKAYGSMGERGQEIQNFLHGTWLGHPVHAVVTDLPIGSWLAAGVLDLLNLASGRKRFGVGADVAVGVGTAGALAAAAAGITDWQYVTNGHKRRIGTAHLLLNTAAAGLYAASLLFRLAGRRRQGQFLSLLGLGVISTSAYLGGHMVYGQRVGVDHAPDVQELPVEFVPVLKDEELPEGDMQRVEADGVCVLLVRLDGQIHAIAETCAHMGGPLADGALEGDTVICPWHGSRYCLHDGRVMDGPSAHDQPLFEARVRDGLIEVRAVQ